MKTKYHRQAGVSLIEVLVAILILSFGLLSLGAMLSYAVQLPKLSGFRSTATLLAAGHIERMRANPDGFANGFYNENNSFNGTDSVPSLADCAYPACTTTNLSNTLAAMDVAYVKRALRQELPSGGIRVARATVDGSPSNTAGDLWIIWAEPSSFAAINSANSDNCPTQIVGNFTPQPRCLYVRFEL